MGKETLGDKIRDLIGSIGWKLFLWSNEMTAEEYWKRIYEQEVAFRENPNSFIAQSFAPPKKNKKRTL